MVSTAALLSSKPSRVTCQLLVVVDSIVQVEDEDRLHKLSPRKWDPGHTAFSKSRHVSHGEDGIRDSHQAS